ncbi:hypothetical protein BDZ97DRAFT_1775992 [Flammula alnicola]|nr:hypothetical protein BDZ97DRAFT_1775992 [Flammula alnicola]
MKNGQPLEAGLTIALLILSLSSNYLVIIGQPSGCAERQIVMGYVVFASQESAGRRTLKEMILSTMISFQGSLIVSLHGRIVVGRDSNLMDPGHGLLS